MNILCMDINLLVPALRGLGHNVLAWKPENGGLHNLPEFLHEKDFKPNLLIQAESLGARKLLEGLDEIGCPKIFWAIDSHLNLYWQKYYARLFDAVLTPHLSLWKALPTEEQHPLVRQMARQGSSLPWVPHAERLYNLAFAGVQNRHRPLRAWLCELVNSRWPMELRQNIPFAEMMELYSNSRIIPNESIAFEVNYRLMESAGAGAAPLTPDIGPDQDALFEPGHEMLVYQNACDMMNSIEKLLAEPELAERIGRAAWERVQRDHLPVNRARQIVHTAESVMQGRTPEEYSPCARRFFFQTNLWMSRVQGRRGRCCGLDGSETAELPAPPLIPRGHEHSSETLNLSLRCELESDRGAALLPDIKKYLQNKKFIENIELAVGASFGARRLGDVELAERILADAAGGIQLQNRPAAGSLPDFCLAWAELLIKRGHKVCSGFTFDPRRQLPSTAMDVLIYLEMLYPAQYQSQALYLANLALLGERAFAYFRMGYLARQALLMPANWQTQLEYGLECLSCYRMKEGIHELAEAACKARQANEFRTFTRLLSLHDKSGAIVRELLLEYNQ